MVSHPETGSDSPIGSDQYRGRDTYSHLNFFIRQLNKRKSFFLRFFSFFLVLFRNKTQSNRT